MVKYMKKVVIIVPMPKVQLSKAETISLCQLRRILSKYPIKFIVPKKKKDIFKIHYPETDIVCFSDDYFTSAAMYSRLCLSSDLYERFIDYKYMLIYQLDAFVFSDKLLEFCNMEYDFIGAPMPRIWWPKLVVHSFNGGLSLRKISTFIRITKSIDEILYGIRNANDFIQSEDAFYSYCGELKDIDFSVPPFSLAARFSLQADTAHCYRNLSFDNLPFGCHGWTKKQYFAAWRPFIENVVGSIDDIAEFVANKKGFLYKQMRRVWIDYYYLFPRVMRKDNNYAKNVMKKFIPLNHEYILWGNGFWGEDAVKCLKYLSVNIVYIFDKKAKKGEKREGIPVVNPEKNILKSNKYKVLITTTAFEREIYSTLINEGFRPDVDFFSYLRLKKLFLDEYYFSPSGCFCKKGEVK